MAIGGDRCAKITVDLDGHARIVFDLDRDRLGSFAAATEAQKDEPAAALPKSVEPARPRKNKARVRPRPITQRRLRAKRIQAEKARRRVLARKTHKARPEPKGASGTPMNRVTEVGHEIGEPGRENSGVGAEARVTGDANNGTLSVKAPKPNAVTSSNPIEEASTPGQSAQLIVRPDETTEATPLYLPVLKSGEIHWQLEKAAEPRVVGEQNLGGQSREPGGNVLPPKKKILVIDDDPVMRMLLKMGLCSWEFECLLAENGKVGQTVLQAEHPEVILLDLLMPVMDGLSFLHWLRETMRDQTPVLVFSNVNDPKVTQEAIKVGANGFACKPLHLKELLGTIHKLLLR
jgi:CheY-like chemotaxis protein